MYISQASSFPVAIFNMLTINSSYFYHTVYGPAWYCACMCVLISAGAYPLAGGLFQYLIPGRMAPVLSEVFGCGIVLH